MIPKFVGEWYAADQREVFQGIEDMRGFFVRIGCSNAFEGIYGNVQYVASYNLQNLSAVTVMNRISMQVGQVTRKLVVHEMFHQFQIIHPEAREWLAHNGIYTEAGEFITGFDVRINAYNRHGGRVAPENGYKSDEWQDGYQLHPRQWMNGNTPQEDFADLMMNIVYDDLVNNLVGQTLYAWGITHMREWLGRITLPEIPGGIL